MSWRTALGALSALLLPLPLVLVLGSILNDSQTWTRPSPDMARTVPVLSYEERLSRVTYHRECKKHSDCEAPLACFADIQRRQHYCTDSECTTDAQCLEGQRCHVLAALRDGPRVRWCVAVGIRQEGEACLDHALDPRHACQPGLLCGDRVGWCGRSCRLDDAASCPEGFFCGDVEPEPLCLPTCEVRGCPEGQRCIRHKDGVSTCAVVHGTDCQHAACPEAQECEVAIESSRPGEAWMRCFPRCGRRRGPCPEGLVCDRALCQPPCDPSNPDACAKGYHCTRRSKLRSPYLCEPDFWPKQ